MVKSVFRLGKPEAILLIEPHPDDVFIGMHEICTRYGIYKDATLVTVTEGTFDVIRGTHVEELASIRRTETMRYAQEVGFKNSFWLGLRDQAFTVDALTEKIMTVMEKLETNRKEVEVFVPSKYELHRDHELVHSFFKTLFPNVYTYCIITPPGDSEFRDSVEVEIENGSKERAFKRMYPSQYDSLMLTYKTVIKERMEREIVFF